MNLQTVISKQREFFHKSTTKNVAYRKVMLQKLLTIMKKNEAEILEALNKDLGKSTAEGYITEISIVYNEIHCALNHLSSWAKPKRVRTTLATFPAKNYIYSEPYGVVLILAPWNYPFNLSMAPLVGALAAGNTAVMKCSKSSIHTGKLIQKLINENFNANYLYCADPEINYDEVLNQKYDYIFFTGSPNVGKTIMKAASEHLTPVSLELGGKSPCFIDKSANLKLAAKRIVWGKFLNAGQTCISIDYLLVDHAVKEEFLSCLHKEIKKQFNNAQHMMDYPKIINQHHFERLTGLIERAHHVIGGENDFRSQKIAPAIFTDVDFDQEIMKEEIFGPILPVIAYNNLDTIIKKVQERPKPLACYIFTERKAFATKINRELSFGGGCINDVLLHVANHNLPFGGVGNSGMGGYHGKYSFETFSHKKSIVKNNTLFDIPLRYPPYTDKKLNIIKKFL